MAAHRYWRLNFTGVSSHGPISEVELRTSIGGADVTGSGTASSDSGVTPANAFDNNTGTSWTPGASPFNWLQYDFGGSPQDIAEVRLTSTAAYPSAGSGLHALNVSYSDDGVTWNHQGPSFDLTPLVGGATVTFNGFADAISRIASSALSRIAAAGPGVSIAYRAVFNPFIRYDAVDGGPLSLDGTCEVDSTPTDIPVRRQVRLFERVTGRIVRETWSDPVTGAWSFPRLKDNLYTVVGHDYTLVNLAVIVDNVRPT